MGFTITGGMNFTGAGMAITAPIPGDPYFNYTTLLLPGNGTNNGDNNTFVDGSTNNYTITRNGSPTQGIFSPFSLISWSNYFNGSSDYLTVTSGGSAINFTSSYTVECWFYLSSNLTYIGGNTVYFGRILTGPFGGLELYVGSANSSTTTPTTIVVFSGSGGPTSSLSATGLSIPIKTWHHVAVCRDASNVTSIYLNGTRVATGTILGTYLSATPTIGGEPSATNNVGYFPGYISNLRVVKGSTVYDPTQTTITVPTSPLTAIANTSLLTCQSNYFKDNSSNAYTLAPSGSQTLPFNPFLPTTPYSSTVNQASCYLDGSSTLQWSGTTVSISAFSFECYFYLTSYSSTIAIFGTNISYGLNVRILSNKTVVQVDQYGVSNEQFTVPTMYAGSWYHLVVCRNASNQMTVFLNGVRSSTGASTVSTDYSGATKLIGGNSGVTSFPGYITNVRFVVGSTVYDPTQTTITVPTTQPTAVANTKLLLNMDNAQIIDNTVSTDIITVGSAKVSTAVYKYGTGSISCTRTGSGGYLNIPTGPWITFGTGDFTVECWVYLNSQASSGQQNIFDTRPASTNGVYPMLYINATTGVVAYWVSSADRITGSALSTGAWYHIALSRVSSQTKLFVNGTQAGSTYADTNSYIASNLLIGASYAASASIATTTMLDGYIDDFRVTNGVGRYSSNFTAPTAAFPTY